jgi:hypothetical protein
MSKFLVSMLVLLACTAHSQESDVLTVDRAVTKNIHLSFPNDSNTKPKESDFTIINYVLMSNDTGERWGVITLTNSSSGARSFEQDHLMALFADGSRGAPQEYKLNFKAGETQSITVSFGEYKFPILSIYSSDDL